MFDDSEGEDARAFTRRAEHTLAGGVAWDTSVPTGKLRSHRVLVVEDSSLASASVSESLQQNGYTVVGPTGCQDEACALAQATDLDGAVLNLELGKVGSYVPAAMLLKARGIPFVIVGDCPPAARPAGVEPAAWITRPMEPGALTAAVARALAQRVSGGSAEAGSLASSRGCISEASPPKCVLPERASRAKAGRVRILLVEGDPETRAKLAVVLAKQGFDVQSLDKDPLLFSVSHVAEKIVCGKLVIDRPGRGVWWNGVEVHLTAGEFAIVVLLVTQAGSCVENRIVYETLHHKGFVSGQGDKGFWVNVRSVVRHIRNKFKAVDSSFAELENARAFGYRWRKPS